MRPNPYPNLRHYYVLVQSSSTLLAPTVSSDVANRALCSQLGDTTKQWIAWLHDPVLAHISALMRWWSPSREMRMFGEIDSGLLGQGGASPTDLRPSAGPCNARGDWD